MKDNKKKWYVYIVRCLDNTLYTGIARNLAQRIEQHNSNKGAKYTRSRGPVTLVYAEEQHNRSEASKREYQIKQMSLRHKTVLIGQENLPLT
ncbi:MAG: GIY-YIG nuclease family protein [Proteobacteria bacterium]|nr:GIY-YIG nuclease family protein [Pseudomonadota bacterium]MBU1716571.1 GIY-YIG nuclease family protein [Pseudomonadota bacterium]